jgi:hypothetical protein
MKSLEEKYLQGRSISGKTFLHEIISYGKLFLGINLLEEDSLTEKFQPLPITYFPPLGNTNFLPLGRFYHLPGPPSLGHTSKSCGPMPSKDNLLG